MIEPFAGRTLVLAPHMDDEVIGCGGAIAALPDKREIFVAYATDGRSLPGFIPATPLNTAGTDLRDVRAAEAMAALTVLGVPADNSVFLDLPAAGLTAGLKELTAVLASLVERLKPDRLLIPFRYDFHDDHTALNAAGRTTAAAAGIGAMEYFVYWRRRLLPRGDVRRHIKTDHLVTVDTAAVAETKRRALNCFKSQTTAYFPGQDNPVLMPDFIERVANSNEAFLNWPEGTPSGRIFDIPESWIRIAHRLEPWLIRRKYFLKTGFRK